MDTSTLPGIGIKPLLSLRRHYRAGLAAAALVVLVGTPVAWIRPFFYFLAESAACIGHVHSCNLVRVFFLRIPHDDEEPDPLHVKEVIVDIIERQSCPGG